MEVEVDEELFKMASANFMDCLNNQARNLKANGSEKQSVYIFTPFILF